MDSPRAGYLTRREDSAGVEVAVGAPRAAYADGLIGDLRVERVFIRGGIHRNGLYPKLAAGAYHS